jgi:hypothetical protein
MKIHRPAIVTLCATLMVAGCEKHRETQAPPDAKNPRKDGRTASSSARMDSVFSEKGFDDPADAYFHAYLLIKKADEAANRDDAVGQLQEAIIHLEAVRMRFPDWKTVMVEGRLKDTQEKLARVSDSER